jgi:CHAT domain-containing protein/Tfp pilus assembly protein PilF
LKVGIPVERSLSPGGRDEIPLDLEAGFYLRIALDGRGAGFVARLLDPGGEMVAGDEGDAEGRLAVISAVKGTYRLVVTAPRSKVPFHFQAILLQQRRAIRPEDDQRLTAEVALSMARREKDAVEAARQAQEALRLWRELGDSDGEFEALDVIRAGDRENAVSWYRKALQQAQAAGSLSHQARARTDLGEALTRQGQLEEASVHFEEAMKVWKDLGNDYQRARALYYLGYGSSQRGNSEDAVTSLREAASLADPTWEITPDIWNLLGHVYSDRGENHEALDCFERALRFATDMDRRGTKAAALASLGNLHWRRGEPRIAIDELEQSLRLNESDPDLQPYTPNVQLLLGTTDLGLGQPREALGNFQAALEAFRQRGDALGISRSLVSIGRAHLVLDQPLAALEDFQEALKIATAKLPKQRGIALQWIGIAQLQLRQVSQAVRSLQEALETQAAIDRPGQILTEQKLGEAYREQGNPLAARESLQKALTLAAEVEASYLQPPILFDLALLDRQRRDLPAALEHIEAAIKILETVRSDLSDDRLRTSFFASRRAYYDFYVDLLMELDHENPGRGYTDLAFDASEKERARSLLDLLAKGRSELTQGISALLRQQEGEIQARLSQIRHDLVDARSDEKKARLVASLEEQLMSFSGQQREIEARIKSESPHYAQIRYPSPIRRGEIQALLRADEALLEYSVGEESAYLFVVTSEGLTVHPLSTTAAKLGEAVAALRPALENGGRLTNAYLRTASLLYQELVVPAQEELKGKRRLLIAPDGALHHLAFEALLTRRAERESDCRFLVEDRAISYIPSASVLSSLQAPTSSTESRKRLIAFAPAYGPASLPERATRSAGSETVRGESRDSPLPDLEGARQEVARIADLYSERDRAVYVGPAASRENFKRSLRAVFLHFAGHGTLDEEHPERSSLELTDGSLRVDDIFNLELSSDLVVLSACRTAGKVVTGEGLVGLTRAFLYAGAPSIVVTLWQAVDASARDLMVQFYTNLGREDDKAEALRQAKLALIEQGRQAGGRLARPYYWAPFILVGKPR